MAEEIQAPFPTGAYITGVLLLGAFGLLIWLIASYPGNPSERAGTNNCESVAQQYHRPDRTSGDARNPLSAVKNSEATPKNSATDQTNGQIDNERQIAKYECQLAIYTGDLAYFTKWLVYATSGLIIIGLLQGYFLQKSVRVADRAAIEARDAIVAAGASANASLRSAVAAERSLTFIERPWIDVRLDRSGDVTIGADAITAEIGINIRNFGRSPALRTSPTLRLLPTFDAAQRAYDTAVEVARQIHLDIPIRTIRGMLAPNEPYEEISIQEMRRPGDDELPPADPENDYFGLFMVACVSYAAPASTRPLYTAGIFEIAFRDGRSIDFRNRGDFVLSAYEITIRDLGFSRAV